MNAIDLDQLLSEVLFTSEKAKEFQLSVTFNNFCAYTKFEIYGNVESQMILIKQQCYNNKQQLAVLNHPNYARNFQNLLHNFEINYKKTFKIIYEVWQTFNIMCEIEKLTNEQYFAMKYPEFYEIIAYFLCNGALVVEKQPPQVLKTNIQ